jgi:hypothetical protein
MELITKVQFLPNRWGRGLEQFKVPCQIFKDNVLTLNPCATKMILSFYLRAQGKNQQLQHKGPQREPGIPLAISQREFTERTGYARNSLTAGTKELVAKGWLEPLPEKRARPKRESYRFTNISCSTRKQANDCHPSPGNHSSTSISRCQPASSGSTRCTGHSRH